MEMVCPKCHGSGIVKDEKGIHTCWDCLMNGNLDAHSKKLPETSLRKLVRK
jgi:ribosomal protein L37AE/L43A